MPHDFTEYVPLESTDYSNCFRSFSTLVFGNEERHNELRVHCVVEMTLFKDFYLSDEIVQRVMRQINVNTTDKKSLAMSEQASPAFTHVDMVFQNEVLATCSQRSQPSDWHILALGSVIGRSIMSVYPETTSQVTIEIYTFQVLQYQLLNLRNDC